MTDNSEMNKKIFAKNFNYYLAINNKTQADIVSDLKITASTVSDWANAKKYPRVDKMQMLADYFGILKSDLTEEHATSKLTDDIELQEYINILLSHAVQQKATKHELKHIKSEHFYDYEPVVYNELEANAI